MPEKFCLSPWHHMNINNKGQVKPCCLFWNARQPEPNENIFKWYETAYEDVKEEGLEHIGCTVCKKQESLNIPSRRQWRGSLGEGKENQITYLDMSFGNTCNLKCRMCESRNSTKWIKDEQELVKQGFDIEREIIKKYEMPDERLDQIVEYLNNTEVEDFTLEIKGGEPFVTEQFLNFIDRLEDSFKKKTELVIFSNGTGISDYYIEKLKTFKEIKCNLSVEAVGPLYNYIRGGEKHNDIDAIDFMTKMNKRLDNFKPGVSVTVTMYNIFDLPNLLDAIKKYLGPGTRDFSKAFSSISYNPTYLDPANLPQFTKDKLIAKYKKCPSFAHVVKYLEERPRDAGKWKKFKEFTSMLDDLRKENIFDVAPEFKEIWNEE